MIATDPLLKTGFPRAKLMVCDLTVHRRRHFFVMEVIFYAH